MRELQKSDVLTFFARLADIMAQEKKHLIEMDALSGDGDLGFTMSKGFAAANECAKEAQDKDIGTLLFMAGRGMAAAVPSTMGTLMSSGLLGAGKALKGKETLSSEDFAAFAMAYFEAVQKRGKANLGERTVLDSLKPAADKAQELVESREEDWSELTKAVHEAALAGVEATRDMAPVHGKAYVHRNKLKGVPDQGAVVGALLYRAWKEALE